MKVEIDQLIISILDDPSVSRVMKEAGFSSTNVKFNLEDGPASAAATAAAAVAAAAVTVASGGPHVGHEPEPARDGVDMVSQGIFVFYMLIDFRDYLLMLKWFMRQSSGFLSLF